MLSKNYQYLLRKTHKRLIPLHCLFELTYRCNLRCVHCYIARAKVSKKEITKDEVFAIFRQLKESGCLYLTLSGGEILLRKDFFEIAAYARKLNFALRLFTNGTLINEDIVDKIKALRPLSVEASVYGFQDTHDKITQAKGSFHKTTSAIKLLSQRKVRVLAKIILLRQNSGEIWGLRDYLKSIGAKMRGRGGALLISPCDNGHKHPLSCRLTDRQLGKYTTEEYAAFKLSGKVPVFSKISPSQDLCGAGKNTCNITPDMELNPCVLIRVKKDNSLKEKSFRKIWQENTEINKLRSLSFKDKRECLGCRFSAYCISCPGIAGLEKGSFLAKVPEFCRQARIRKDVYEKYRAAG